MGGVIIVFIVLVVGLNPLILLVSVAVNGMSIIGNESIPIC